MRGHMRCDTPNKAASPERRDCAWIPFGDHWRRASEPERSAAPMRQPSPNQVYWLLVDLCEKSGSRMAIRDIDRFQAVVIHGPDVFTDAVLTAEGIAPDVDKQMRRELNTFVAARFVQWEGESDAEQGCSSERTDCAPVPFSASCAERH